MHCVRNVTEDLIWIGGNDRQSPCFESDHPVPRGMSYNSYLLLDEKTVLFDTVDRAVQQPVLREPGARPAGPEAGLCHSSTTWSPTTPLPWATCWSATPRRPSSATASR